MPKYNVNKDSIILFLPATFSINTSWVIKKYETGELLKHEQLHFDIIELFARKLRKRILNTKITTKGTQEQLKKLQTDLQNEENAYQNLYDKQTDHSRNKQKQKEWGEKIAKELKELEDYSDPTIEVKLWYKL